MKENKAGRGGIIFWGVLFCLVLLLSCQESRRAQKIIEMKVNTFETSYPLENLTDGDPETYFQFIGRNKFITFDLGEVKSLEAVRIDWAVYGLYPQRYSLEASLDGKRWTTLIREGTGPDYKPIEPELLTFPPVEARYFKYIGHKNHNYLGEIEFYSFPDIKPELPPLKLTALYQPGGAVEISWEPPPGEKIDHFLVLRSLKEDSPLIKANIIGRTGDTFFIDWLLSPYTTYYYRVAAMRRPYFMAVSSNVASFETGEAAFFSVVEGALLALDFNDHPVDFYRMGDFIMDWKNPAAVSGIREERAAITGDPKKEENRVLRVSQLKSATGILNTGAQWRFHLPGDYYEEISCFYRFKFSENFDFLNGGFLPGLAGGEAVLTRNYKDQEGWLCRFGWDKNKILQLQILSPLHKDESFNCQREGIPIYLRDGLWYRVELRIKMNTPGKSDGSIRGRLNGIPVVTLENISLRNILSFAIDTFHFRSSHYELNLDAAPREDHYIYFDDFVISENPISYRSPDE